MRNLINSIEKLKNINIFISNGIKELNENLTATSELPQIKIANINETGIIKKTDFLTKKEYFLTNEINLSETNFAYNKNGESVGVFTKQQAIDLYKKIQNRKLEEYETTYFNTKINLDLSIDQLTRYFSYDTPNTYESVIKNILVNYKKDVLQIIETSVKNIYFKNIKHSMLQFDS